MHWTTRCSSTPRTAVLQRSLFPWWPLYDPRWPKICHSLRFPQHMQSMDHFGAPLYLARLLCIVRCVYKYIIFDWLSGAVICELPWQNPRLTHDCVRAIKLTFAMQLPPQNEQISAADLLCHGPRLVAFDSLIETDSSSRSQYEEVPNDIKRIKIWNLPRSDCGIFRPTLNLARC
ncbi:hypothetical protein BC940DRAFT_49597 [Gongronella butleri]|nr:hypothetical protein BC940DRAFT_49597 [Gongronella butleri]